MNHNYKSPNLQIILLFISLTITISTLKAAVGNITTSPSADSSNNVIVAVNGTVTFTVNPGTDTITSCSGTFQNGSNPGPASFSGSITETFGASAQGHSNTCTITLTTLGTHGEGCSASKHITFDVFVPQIETLTWESVPSDPGNDRTTIGIGEQVFCDIVPSNTPGSAHTTWDNSGSGTFNIPEGADVVYSAYSNKESDTVTATLGDPNFTKVTVTFNVLRPTSFADISQGDVTGSQNPLGCGFTGGFYAGPDSVNFYNCGEVEGTCSASTTGCFSSEQGLAHDPTGNGQGNGPPTPIPFSSTVLASYGTAVGGTDTSAGSVPSGAGANPQYNPPYNPGGTFLWPIPEIWVCDGNEASFDTGNSYYWVTISGNNMTATIDHTKGGTGNVAECKNPVTGTNVP